MEVFVQFTEIYFFKFVGIGSIDDGAGVAVHKPAFAFGRGGIAQDVVDGSDFHGRAAVVLHLKAYAGQRAVFGEGVYFVYPDAVFFGGGQAHFYFAVFRFIGFGGSLKGCVGQDVASVCSDKPGLGDVGERFAVCKKAEGFGVVIRSVVAQ